ncbi:MAG TPA: VOC family protein [Longimicrobiales bacterium]|nr:VOC family protein [Longimicrobiales bacterium]
MLKAIGQVAVPVHDLERAVRFYRDTLGLELLFEVPKMAFLQCGGVRLMLTVPDDPAFDHPASIIYYRVDDITAASGKLKTLGTRFEAEPHRVADMGDHELWMAFLRDSEDNVLALMSEVPKAGEGSGSDGS